MASVSINTWWIDSGSTIHIANSLQGMQNLIKPVGNEQRILLGNKLGSHVEAIETCILTLSSGFIWKLEMTFYVLSFPQKLITISRLTTFGYSFNFKDVFFYLFYNFECVVNDTLSDSLHLSTYNIS